MTDSRQSGAITGTTHDARSIAVAGALAEAGVTTLTVNSPHRVSLELDARSTDLPGMLRDAMNQPPHVAQLSARGDTSIEVIQESIRWRSADPKIAACLQRVSL